MKPTEIRETCPDHGFTLIELSIVLVIIGLIVGGVLVGVNLIRAAEVRATIAQIEKYQTAVNTFYGKYQALPGDIAAADATSFGFIPAGRSGGFGNGNNDGMITGQHPDWFAPYTQYDEPLWFWVDLSANTHLIDGTFGSAPIIEGQAAITTSQLGLYYPEAKLGGGNYICVYNYGGTTGAPGTNYFAIVALTGVNAGGLMGAGDNLGLTPSQAYGIDTKIDDGRPQTGNVQAFWLPLRAADPVTWSPSADPGTSSTCFDQVTNQYNVDTNTGIASCTLSLSFH